MLIIRMLAFFIAGIASATDCEKYRADYQVPKPEDVGQLLDLADEDYDQYYKHAQEYLAPIQKCGSPWNQSTHFAGTSPVTFLFIKHYQIIEKNTSTEVAIAEYIDIKNDLVKNLNTFDRTSAGVIASVYAYIYQGLIRVGRRDDAKYIAKEAIATLKVLLDEDVVSEAPVEFLLIVARNIWKREARDELLALLQKDLK